MPPVRLKVIMGFSSPSEMESEYNIVGKKKKNMWTFCGLIIR